MTLLCAGTKIFLLTIGQQSACSSSLYDEKIVDSNAPHRSSCEEENPGRNASTPFVHVVIVYEHHKEKHGRKSGFKEEELKALLWGIECGRPGDVSSVSPLGQRIL